jgi:hypothetical protein
MSTPDPLLRLLGRLRDEGAEYVLIGGQAVRLNGYLRATEDIDLLVRATRVNGEKIIRALGYLDSSRELDAEWFAQLPGGEVENIRVADELNIDGLIKTKTNYREKDLLDKQVLLRIKQALPDEPQVR